LDFAEVIANRLTEEIDQLQIKIDSSDNLRPADKFFHWIQQGVPVRIEVGPRDVKKRSAIVARRDIREKDAVPVEQITQHVVNLLENIQQKLFERALNYRKENTRTASSYEEFKDIISKQGGFISAHWDGSKKVEAQIKKETKATIRCLPLENNTEPGKCMVTGLPSAQKAIFAIAY
jgi:Prolyl-tRNA synthetase